MDNFYDVLKDGTLLCRLVNNIKPGSVKKINESKMAFKCMENISAFLAAARDLGVPAQETFQTVDLWERQNLNSVVICLQSLGRKVCFRWQQQKTNSIWQRRFGDFCFRRVILGSRASDRKRRKRTNGSFRKTNWRRARRSLACRWAATRGPTNRESISATHATCKLYKLINTLLFNKVNKQYVWKTCVGDCWRPQVPKTVLVRSCRLTMYL